MTGALDQLTAHYARMGRRRIAVDLGGGEEFVCFAAPPTARDAAAVERRAKGSSAKMALYTVIYMARDAEGGRLFQDDAETVAKLENAVSAEIVADLASQIMAVAEVSELGN
mgnify:CR=1 FL=1